MFGFPFTRFLTLLLVLTGFLSFNVLTQPEVALAESATEKAERIRELRERSQDLQRQAKEFQRKKREKQRQAAIYNSSFLKNQQALERKRQSRFYHIQNLNSTKNRIVYLDQKIDHTTGEAGRLSDDAGKRLRSLYMGERLSMLQMILEAKDLSSLLDRLYYKQRLVNQDKQLLNALRNKVQELGSLKGELNRQKSALDSTISTIRVQEAEIARSAEVDRSLRDKYLNDARYFERAERQLLSESQGITSELRRLSTRQLTLDKNVATGAMLWPIRGPVTSGFGSRFHPIHRVRTMHTGLDIAGPNRGAVRAADGGKVIFAGWKGGYGKCVMINHGFKGNRNIVTLYGHLSSFNVGSGQYVNKGDVIAAEGSTGYSTGPHLHFEVRVNGAPVNPYSYLP